MCGRGAVIYGAVTMSRQWDQRGGFWLSVCVPGELDFTCSLSRKLTNLRHIRWVSTGSKLLPKLVFKYRVKKTKELSVQDDTRGTESGYLLLVSEFQKCSLLDGSLQHSTAQHNAVPER